ncbi:MAG: M28 family peptidase [Bdellovibrionales bacterium]|nr:M28 family peptidase [Massilia sp.]
MKKRVIGLSLFALVVAYIFVVGKLEAARIAAPLESAAVASGPAVDTARLVEDVRSLAAPAMKGRRTGTDGSKLAQAYITKRFEQIGLQPYGASYVMPFSFTHTSLRALVGVGKSYKAKYPSAANLVGYINGSAEPGRIMVVSAHYDHLGECNGVMYPGADDNASGVGAMLAIAAYFKQHPPRNTIVFAAFDAEELGLKGAEAFVASLPFPRERLAMNLNLDMVSRNDNNEIWVAGVFHNPMLKDLVAAAAKRSALKVKIGHDKPLLFAGTVEDWTGSSDHGPFHAAGVPFLYFGVEDHADYHQSTDVADKINPQFYSQVTSLLIDVAATADLNLQMLK